MGWVAHRAFERADGTPAAVYDRGDLGKEAITRLLAPDPETAIDQALALAEVIGAAEESVQKHSSYRYTGLLNDITDSKAVIFDSKMFDWTGSIVMPFEPICPRMQRKTISVTGMSCNGCEQTVGNALKTIDGVTRVDADHEGDTVEIVVEETVTDDLHAAIEQAGYDVAA